MTEQPALTPDQENELRLYAMGGPAVPSAAAVRGLLAELAREREVRERAEHDAATVRHHDACETTRADRAEGRVRKLREALGRIENFPYDVARDGETELRQVKEIAREALVGLPEGQEP